MRPPPAFAHLPPGFYLGGAVSIFFGSAMLLAAVALAGAPAENWEIYAARGVFVLLASLALITAEALWTPRPWAFRAGVALAVCYAATLLAIMVLAPGAALPLGAVLLASAAVVIPFLRNVRAQQRQAAPGAGTRIPVPRP